MVFIRYLAILTFRHSLFLSFFSDDTLKIPPYSAEEVDPTGAGDSFLAAFASGICNGLSPIQAVHKGNYFGSLAVAQVGVPKISEEDIERWRTLSVVKS